MQAFTKFLTPREDETGEICLADDFAKQLFSAFQTVDALLAAPTFRDATESSSLDDVYQVMSLPQRKRFKVLWERAKIMHERDLTGTCLKLFCQAAFHVYYDRLRTPSPFKPSQGLLEPVVGGDRELQGIKVRVQVYTLRASAADGPVVVVAIRGSDNLENWLVNLQASLVQADKRLVGDIIAPSTGPTTIEAPMVHVAWQKAALLLSAELDNVLSELSELQSPSHLYCVGHSLGGSLSVLLALIRSQCDATCKVHALTWGAPMVGNSAFNKACKLLLASEDGKPRVLQFVNDLDPVPKVPSSALGFLPLWDVWPETRVRIDVPESRRFLDLLAAAPCAVSMLLSGRKAAAAAEMKRVLRNTMSQVQYMHSTELYFQLTLCYLGEIDSAQQVTSNEPDRVGLLADTMRGAAFVYSCLPSRETVETADGAIYQHSITMATTAASGLAKANLAIGAANLAVSLVSQGLTLRSIWRLKESIGDLCAQLPGQIATMEVGLTEKMEDVQSQLGSKIATLGEQLVSRLKDLDSSIPSHLRDARLDGYKETLFASFEQLLHADVVNETGRMTKNLDDIDCTMLKVKYWLRECTDVEREAAVMHMLLMVHAGVADVIAKAPRDDTSLNTTLKTQFEMLKWLAEAHGKRLWESGAVALTSPRELEVCMLLSSARSSLVDSRPQIADQHGLKNVLPGGDQGTCFREIAFDPVRRQTVEWMPWLQLAKDSGQQGEGRALACVHAAGALINGDSSVVAAAVSLLEGFVSGTQHDLRPLEPNDWLALVVDAYYVHSHSKQTVACIEQLIRRLGEATLDTSPAAALLIATGGIIRQESDALPELMWRLCDPSAAVLSAGRAAAMQLCSDRLRTLSKQDMTRTVSSGERVSICDAELPANIAYNSLALFEIALASSLYFKLLDVINKHLKADNIRDQLQLEDEVVHAMQQRADCLRRGVEIASLRKAYLRELRSRSPDADALRRNKAMLIDIDTSAWINGLALQEEHALKTAQVNKLLLACRTTKVQCNEMLDDIVKKDLPDIIKTLSNADQQHEQSRHLVDEELQALTRHTQNFTRELCSTVVFTGTTSAGKSTTIDAMLCSAQPKLRMTLLPTSGYSNTNSVTELHLHPASSEPCPLSIKRTWWAHEEGAEPSPASVTEQSFEDFGSMRQTLMDWQKDSKKKCQKEVDSREIHLQSRLKFEMLLIDTPGLGSTNEMVGEALNRIVSNKLFVCVVVINCFLPDPIGGDVLTTLRKLADIGHKAGAYVPPVFVFTHWDIVEDKEGLRDVLQQLASDLRTVPEDGGPAILREGMPCFFASINGRDALRSLEAGLRECDSVRDIDDLLNFLCMYCGGLEGMLRSLRLLHETLGAVQRMTNILFKDNDNTKPFSELSEKELDAKVVQLKVRFKQKLTEKLDGFPSNAAELRKVVANLAIYSPAGALSLANLLKDAEECGPRTVDKMQPPADGTVWTAKSRPPTDWRTLAISSSGRHALEDLLRRRDLRHTPLDGDYDSDVEWVAEIPEATWEQLVAVHKLVLRTNSGIVIDGMYWAPMPIRRDMIKYQEALSKFFRTRFQKEFLNEIAVLQKESMDELTVHINSILDLDKFSPLDNVRKMELTVCLAGGGAVGLGVGGVAWGVGVGFLGVSGVVGLVALPLIGLAGGLWKWGQKQRYGLTEEQCVDRSLDHFLQSFVKHKDELRDKVSTEFDKTLDALLTKLKSDRSQVECDGLAKIMGDSRDKKAQLESELSGVLQELARMDPWLGGDAELETLVKDTRLIHEWEDWFDCETEGASIVYGSSEDELNKGLCARPSCSAPAPVDRSM